MELSRILWRDAHFDWEASEKPDRSDYLVITVGYVISETPLFLSVAAEVLPDGDGFRAVTHIPMACVQERQPLNGGETE